MEKPTFAPRIWTEPFKVHSYEVDSNKHATLEVLCHYFQEAAWNHAEALGVGYTRLEKEQKLWVLSRLLICIDSFPLWGETVQVRTWPRTIKGAMAMRDFEFLCSDGQRMAAGTSGWLVLDSATRKPQRVDRFLSVVPSMANRRAAETDPTKLPGFAIAPNDPGSRAVTVQHSDIDVNGHVNNARYVGWLMDAYDLDFHRRHRVSSCQVNYLLEMVRGEKLSIQTKSISGTELLHSIVNSEGAEICRASVTWFESKFGKT